ncbi:uncharacterized protein LOC119459292 isoform X4 [Dermacentor silvarum]|uniref:uncharacterized protein LOC119459292 isoform X4 n=1 Tax=Dermacentor silvarum TaxID=543639 RepID=UPI002101B57A|nr:uncharacterized protein LOC119459292 isoform X4 [Dermacentor silvarum]
MDTTFEPSLEDSGPAPVEPCPRKIVFEENLQQLVKSCRKCHLPVVITTGLKKKVQAVSWPWGCGVIEKWATCIINHFYFSVRTAAARVTTAERRDELAVAIWVSLLNHIQKKHYDHSEEYANCEHGDLLPRKWIFPGNVGLLLEIVDEVVAVSVLRTSQLCLHHRYLQALLDQWTRLC